MLERGDVIISLDETFDGFNEGNEYPELRVKSSRKTRLIFDFPKQRFLWVDFYSFNETLSSPDRTEPITISGELVRAVVFFDGECHAREFPREAFKYADGPEVDYSRIVKRYGIPDLRKVGLTPFNSLSLQTYEEFEGDIESFGIGAELTNSKSFPQASRQEVEFEMKDSDDENFTTVLKIDFDTEKFVPTKTKLSGYESTEPGIKPRVGFIYDEKISWSDLSDYEGTVVAKEVTSRIPKSYDVKKNAFTDLLIGKAKLHWISVNKPIPDEAFDFKCVYSLKLLEELVALDKEEPESDKGSEDQ